MYGIFDKSPELKKLERILKTYQSDQKKSEAQLCLELRIPPDASPTEYVAAYRKDLPELITDIQRRIITLEKEGVEMREYTPLKNKDQPHYGTC